jgi:hypothetical protein
MFKKNLKHVKHKRLFKGDLKLFSIYLKILFVAGKSIF